MLYLGIFRLKLRNSSDTFEINSIEFAKNGIFLAKQKSLRFEEKAIVIFEISSFQSAHLKQKQQQQQQQQQNKFGTANV